MTLEETKVTIRLRRVTLMMIQTKEDRDETTKNDDYPKTGRLTVATVEKLTRLWLTMEESTIPALDPTTYLHVTG
uniref:Uncharacterized protein n=1 Tax=Pristionchus pacificus TaxID=54126 RepID=A0A2A6D1H0_PRIPA|eukprot:PDM84332.1 hypothetical protein PRIPAC_33355 [Pristionchus pacificus]